ncbi:MAG: CrcB family protein [Salinarimonadaceae bacterium]|nr:MAG: CrcB family protein [Salinarimonadaceae bacterium]
MSAGGGAILAVVAAGGALGALARYGLAILTLGAAFPWATLLANILGSFLIGWAGAALLREGAPPRPLATAFVMAGFCGGFTTFSLFSLEAVSLWRDGAPELAALYVAVSLVTWLPACAAGWRFGEALRS